MPKPFDATLRELFEVEPAAWLEYLGIPVPDRNQVRAIDSNLSTFTSEADKVLWVEGDAPFIIHIEFATGRDPALPDSLNWYNTALGRRHHVPVWSVVVLLRPAADGPELSGVYEKEFPSHGKNLWFRYDVVRVWLEPPERLLSAGLPLLPLAAVSKVALEKLPDVLTAVAVRLRDEAKPRLKASLWSATAILMGLRYPREQVGEMIEGVATMVLGIRGIEESWVYQDIFAKGEAKGEARGEAKGRAEGLIEEARTILLHLGHKKFGGPSDQVLARVAAIDDLDSFSLLLDRILDTSSWQELLASLDEESTPDGDRS
jgi:predicted transposase YdaD